MYELSGDDFGDDEAGDDLMIGSDDFGDDEAGDDEAGDDSLIVGAAAPARRRRVVRHVRRQGGRKMRLQRIQPVKQTQVCSFPQGPNGSLVVGAGLPGVLTARPQRPFQTERFVVPSSLSAFFAILDLVIGRDSMFVNAEAAHADIFSQTGVHVTLRGYIARPGIDITLTVENIDTEDHPFYGSIIGPTLV